MNYYNNIKNLLIDNEVKRKVREYSQNKSDLETYYQVGKELALAGKHYGEGIIKKYSEKLTEELGKRYSVTNLKYLRQFYLFAKSHSLSDRLNWTHYRTLLSIKNYNEIEYYIFVIETQSLSVRFLKEKIKNKEYERLDEETKSKLVSKEKSTIKDFIKHPIIIKNTLNKEIISEKVLKQLILEDLDSFLLELGSGYSYIANEYKIKVGNIYNYIDKHIKTIYQAKTIGVIITRKGNKYIVEYSSNPNIISTTYQIT